MCKKACQDLLKYLSFGGVLELKMIKIKKKKWEATEGRGSIVKCWETLCKGRDGR